MIMEVSLILDKIGGFTYIIIGRISACDLGVLR